MHPTRAILFLAASLSVLHGQPPAFEAASIKPSDSGRSGSGINVQPARIRVNNSSLKFCVQSAWNVKDFQVAGATGWMENDRFDIDAVAAAQFQPGEFRAMLQTLLTDRFGLVTHRETQERQGYALIVGRNGAKLPAPTDSPEILFSRTPSGDVKFTATGATLEQLASALANALGAPVVDRTNIEGHYNVSLEYAQESTGQPMLSKSGQPLPPPPPDAVPAPSIFTAVQERLGLKLEARKVPVEVIVIDRAHRPSEN